jgi:hypothetical protein
VKVFVLFLAACSAGSQPPAPDAAPPCVLGATSCDGASFQRCTEHGVEIVASCPEACDPVDGCVACIPGTHRCDGDRSLVCMHDRRWALVRDCGEWESACGPDGFCDDDCAVPERDRDSLGCEYFAASLPSLGVSADALVVANPSDSIAHVELAQWDGITEHEVPPRSATILRALLWTPEWSRFADRDDDPESSPIVRLRSNVPVMVTQAGRFIEETMVGGFHESASLLYPTHAWGRRHIVVGYGAGSAVASPDSVLEQPANIPWRGRGAIAIVGSPHRDTVVQVALTAPIQGDLTGRLPPTAAGETIELRLRPGEIAHLVTAHHPYCTREREGWSDGGRLCVPGDEERCFLVGFCDEPGFDPTGTRIESDQPIAVFAGVDHALIPFDRFMEDHVEEQLPPIDTWGREHLSATVSGEGPGGENLIRVVAAMDGTEVTIEPPQSGTGTVSLDAGEWVELTVTGVFRVAGSQPVLVAQYLTGEGEVPGGSPSKRPYRDFQRGGPSMWIVPPVEQYRSDYPLGLPTYSGKVDGLQFFIVTRATGTLLAIDEIAVAPGEVIGEFEIGVIAANPGMRRFRGDAPFGLVGIGVAAGASYATAQGRGLAPLVF